MEIFVFTREQSHADWLVSEIPSISSKPKISIEKGFCYKTDKFLLTVNSKTEASKIVEKFISFGNCSTLEHLPYGDRRKQSINSVKEFTDVNDISLKQENTFAVGTFTRKDGKRLVSFCSFKGDIWYMIANIVGDCKLFDMSD
jgi:hypothetical protein